MADNKQPVARKPFWVAVAGAGVFVIILSLPERQTSEQESMIENPQERAEELISGLLTRLGSEADRLPVELEAPPAPTDPVRDLFAPIRAPRPKETPAATPDSAPVAGPRGPGTPTLGGLLTDGGRRLAILNGEPVGEGEVVDGYRVRAIEADGVVLERDGQTKRVKWAK